MIYDALISMDLGSQLGPPLPTPPQRGLENLIFSGRWAERRASCPRSAAAVLARCMRVLREQGYRGLRVQDDAGTVLEQQVPALLGDEASQRWPEALPPRWCEQPCSLALRAQLHSGGAVAAVRLRYTPRHDPEQGALSGSLRALWDIGPKPDEPEAFARSLEAALQRERDLQELARRLRERGEQSCGALLRGLEEAFEAPPGSSWGRVLVLHGYGADPGRFADLLAGLPEDRRAQLPLLERRLRVSRGRWPALAPDGVPGHLHRGRFVPTAELHHVA